MSFDHAEQSLRGRRKPVQVKVWMSREQHDKFVEKVRESGMTQSDFVFESAMNKAVVVTRDDDKIAELMRIRYELSRIGNNLNQIARQVNSAAKARRDSVLYGELGNIDDALSAIIGWLDDIALVVGKEGSR